MQIRARCTCGPTEGFQATMIERRDPGPHDVLIDIAYAGICHSDIDHARSTRGKSMYPLVPGLALLGSLAFIGVSLASDTRNSLFALALVGISWPIYRLFRRNASHAQESD